MFGAVRYGFRIPAPDVVVCLELGDGAGPQLAASAGDHQLAGHNRLAKQLETELLRCESYGAWAPLERPVPGVLQPHDALGDAISADLLDGCANARVGVRVGLTPCKRWVEGPEAA
jgi:hypothetical protein